MPHRDSKALVNERKRDAARFRAMPELPPRFVSRGPVGVWLSWFEAGGTGGGAAPPAQASGELRGTACSPGVVEGTAKVVKEPTEFDGGILVTYRTDPGWITIFPAAKALLVERGSPLTHAAIVARELGLPTIVQIPGLTSRVKHGMELRVDAGRGHIAVVSPEPIVSER
jgi:rifampicin phosphotransferase